MRSGKLSAVLVVLATLSALALHASWWAKATIIDEQGFADAVVEASASPAVQEELRQAIVEQVIESVEPRLVAARPLVEAAVDTALSARAFSSAVNAIALDVHQGVFEEGSPAISLQATRLVDQARELVRAVDPELANAEGWESAADLPLVSVEVLNRAQQFQTAVNWAFSISLVLWPLLTAAALWVSPRRRTTVGWLGAGYLTIGGLSFIVTSVAVLEVQRYLPANARDAVGEALDSFFWPYRESSLWIGGLGLLALAASAASRPDSPPPSLLSPVTLVRQALETRTVKSHPLLKSLALVLLGLAIIYWRDAIVTVLAVAAGAWIAFVGTYGLLYLTGDFDSRHNKRWLPARALFGTVSVLLAASLAFAFVQSEDPEPTNALACNGDESLCDKRVDEVVFPGTHNSMSAARSEGWFSPYQRNTIPQQLNDGVRALLIDTYYGTEARQGVVLTDLASAEAAEEVAEDSDTAVSESDVKRAEEIRNDPTNTGGDREIYLCHAYCELGATKFSDTLNDVSNFLDNNQREVLILFLQDTVPPSETTAAFEDAGLLDNVVTHSPDAQWPTLGELIDTNKRLIVMGENFGPPPEWYLDGFEQSQDTPYEFNTINDFTCAVNRGTADAQLFLINHWLKSVPPTAAVAKTANTYDVLYRRATQCQNERGLMPNILAVDFYEQGDLFEVCDVMNGIRPPRAN